MKREAKDIRSHALPTITHSDATIRLTGRRTERQLERLSNIEINLPFKAYPCARKNSAQQQQTQIHTLST